MYLVMKFLLFNCVVISHRNLPMMSNKMIDLGHHLNKYTSQHISYSHIDKHVSDHNTVQNRNNYLNRLILNCFLWINTLYLLFFLFFSIKKNHRQKINESYVTYSITPSVSQNKNYATIKGIVGFIFVIGIQYLMYTYTPYLYPVIFNVFNLYILSFVYLYIVINNNL